MGNGCRKEQPMRGVTDLPINGKKPKTHKSKPNSKAKKYKDRRDPSKSGTNSIPLSSFNNNEYTGRSSLPDLPGRQTSSKILLKALYDYQPRQDDDLGFSKNDRLELISEDTDTEWWEARHIQTGKTGFVPSNYVVLDDDRPEHQEWFFAFDRREADKQLTLPSNPNGTFLVRTSSDKKSFALSVRMVDPSKESEAGIKHYRVRMKEDGRGCYINPRRAFNSFTELIEHYKKCADGLCCRLTKACPKEQEAVPFKDIEVERSCIRMNEKLGEGMFGEVWRGKWNNQVEVAVKTLRPGSMSAEAFLEEAKLMHKLRHPKLVLLMGVCTSLEPIYIITELMDNGALLDYLRKEKTNVRFPILVDMAAQIASGMSYLEGKNFIHRDVRAANMLVGKNNTVKVADFGLARVLDDDEYTAHAETKFPIKWTAPEAAFDKSFSVKSDVWSFGILLYEMLTFGRVPYPGMSGQEALRSVEKGYRMPKPARSFECPDSLYEMMLKCWAKAPQERPTFEFLYDFFDDYFIATEPHYEERNI